MTPLPVVNQMMLGAIAMVCFTICLFFLRFWKKVQDRFFLFFALSFAVEGCSKIMAGFLPQSLNVGDAEFYSIRLIALLILLWAIIDKNLRARNVGKSEAGQTHPGGSI